MTVNITFSADSAGVVRYHGSVTAAGCKVSRFHGLILEHGAEIPADAEELETLGDERILTVNYLQEIETQPPYRHMGHMRSAISDLALRIPHTMIIYPLPLEHDDDPEKVLALRSAYHRIGFKDLGPLMALT